MSAPSVTRSRPPAPQAAEATGRSWTLVRHLALVLVLGGLLVGATFILEPYRNFQLATAAAYLCATAGLTVLVGLTGQLSLGHGALMGVGAYAVALTQNAIYDRGIVNGWMLAVSLAVGVACAALVGLVLGLAAARLHGPYLAGVTLAFTVAVPAVTVVWSDTFNADQGLSVPVEPPPMALGMFFPIERWQAWLAIAAAMLTLLLLVNLVRGGFGRDMQAVRDDEVAARLSGIDVARTRVLAFVTSAACAGLGGGMLAVITQSVSPGAFSLTLSLFLVMAVVVGGLGSLAGAVWGALLLVLLPELTEAVTDLFSLSPAAAQRLEGNLPLAIFGVVLVVVMIVAPGGIQTVLVRTRRRLANRPRRQPKG